MKKMEQVAEDFIVGKAGGVGTLIFERSGMVRNSNSNCDSNFKSESES
jgi:hypothetical protein